MAKQVYVNNSPQKDLIRNRWLDFVNEFCDKEAGLRVISFPSEELQELSLYKENGLIDWEEVETGGLKITKGHVVCFEKEALKYKKIAARLIGAKVELGEIGQVLQSKFQPIMKGQINMFPVDVVNLDYDGCISTIKVPVTETIETIFQFQAKHETSFSFFLTWPHTEEDDPEAYKNALTNVIKENLQDPTAKNFKEQFEASFPSIDKLDYEKLSLIGMTKIILKHSAFRKFKLTNSELVAYGGTNNRKRMLSLLLNFEFVGAEMTHHNIYSNDVTSSLKEIVDLNGV